MIEVSIEKQEMLSRILGHIPGAVPKIIVRVMNRAAEAAKTEAVREVQGKFFVRQKEAKREIWVRRSTSTNLSADIIAKGNRIPLIGFNVRPKNPPARRPRKLVFARVKRDSGGGAIGSAFVVRVKHEYQATGHVGVFVRVSDNRLPVRQLYSISIPEMLGSKEVSEKINIRAEEIMEKRLDHEIQRALEGAGK